MPLDFEGFVMGRSGNADPEKMVPKVVKVRHYEGHDYMALSIGYELGKNATAALVLTAEATLDLIEELRLGCIVAGWLGADEIEMVGPEPVGASAYWRG